VRGHVDALLGQPDCVLGSAQVLVTLAAVDVGAADLFHGADLDRQAPRDGRVLDRIARHPAQPSERVVT
jgi:hypothetical protein